MDNNDSNPKPQQTGGLKLMTVFIGVLALHVIVIGGITVYHLMNGGSSDADLVTDKTHKSVKVTPDSATVSDGTLSDSSVNDKGATPAADSSGAPVTIPSPAPETATTTTPATGPAPTVPGTSTPAPAQVETTANAPSGPMQNGPVITPVSPAPAVATTPAPTPAPEVATEAGGPTSLDGNMASGGTPYVVKSHETLAKIAHRNHVKTAALRLANALKTDKLHAGQKLIIPARTETASTEEASSTLVKSSPGPDRTLLGDSPSISKHVASSTHDKATLSASGNGRHTYTVAKGDTLNRIAHKFHTTSNALMSLNSISDARKLHPGQKLRIPSQESRSAASAPASTHPDRIEPRATPSAQLANFVN